MKEAFLCAYIDSMHNVMLSNNKTEKRKQDNCFLKLCEAF